MRHIEKALLRLVIYMYILFISVLFAPKIYMVLGLNLFFVNSYIKEINTPSYSNELTIAMLEHFNSYGNGKVVKFKDNGKILSRPITIREVDYIEGDRQIIGAAAPSFDSCDIVIEKNLDIETYYLVLLHEYLHCLGYMHTDDENDLMYYSTGEVKEQNIIYYAKDVEKRNK